jgi:hypothetical protein|tara:strand:+ start:4948 stop:5130 length:183 start_codon:yes stop_codon:yes gene_type:complete
MTRKEMEFVIECIQRYRTWLREDARISEKEIREDDYLNKENIMSKKIIQDMKKQITKQKK